MKKIVCVFILLIIMAFSIASCGPASIQNTVTPVTTFPSGSADVPDGNNAFALDLYKQLKGGDGNIFYSPYSIYAALAMTSAGAKENTLQQMASALHFKTIGEPLHQLFNELDTALKSRSKDIEVQIWDGSGGSETETLDGFRLNIINALWGQEGYPFLEE